MDLRRFAVLDTFALLEAVENNEVDGLKAVVGRDENSCIQAFRGALHHADKQSNENDQRCFETLVVERSIVVGVQEGPNDVTSCSGTVESV